MIDDIHILIEAVSIEAESEVRQVYAFILISNYIQMNISTFNIHTFISCLIVLCIFIAMGKAIP